MEILEPVFNWSIICGMSAVSAFLAYVRSPYDPAQPNQKYVSVKSPFLAKLLIAPANKKTVQKKNRNKLSVSSLVFYLLIVALLLFAIILDRMPDIPCHPIFIRLTRSTGYTVETLNTALAFLASSLLAVVQLESLLIFTIVRFSKCKDVKYLKLVGLGTMGLLFLSFPIYLILKLCGI